MSRIYLTKLCSNCDAPFTPKGGNAQFCSPECRDTKRKCNRCGESFRIRYRYHVTCDVCRAVKFEGFHATPDRRPPTIACVSTGSCVMCGGDTQPHKKYLGQWKAFCSKKCYGRYKRGFLRANGVCPQCGVREVSSDQTRCDHCKTKYSRTAITARRKARSANKEEAKKWRRTPALPKLDTERLGKDLLTRKWESVPMPTQKEKVGDTIRGIVASMFPFKP